MYIGNRGIELTLALHVDVDKGRDRYNRSIFVMGRCALKFGLNSPKVVVGRRQ